MKPLRLFVGIPAPPAARESAAALVSALRGVGDVRWVQPDLLHLTLKFLRAVPEEQVPELIAALDEAARSTSPFRIESTHLGAFPGFERPSTLWLGVAGDTEALAGLARAVDAALAGLGFEPEKRPFHGHVTIGRVRSACDLRLLSRRLAEVGSSGGEVVPWTVDEIHLVRSDLGPDGPTYTVLHRFLLQG